MLIVNKLIPQGRGMAPVLIRRAATIELDWDVRQKSRFDATDSQGRALGVFLPRGTAVRGGDVLVAEDGSLVRVIAAPQPVLVVTACREHGSAFDLVRAAYHLGNRHVQLELHPDRLLLEPDHVLAGMLRQMHLIVNEATQAFEPETGAYATAGHGHSHAGGGHGHAHGHEHGHSHDHDHDHGHGHEGTDPTAHGAGHVHPRDHGPGARHQHGSSPGHGAPDAASPAAATHVHGPGCGHGHSH